MLEGLGTNPTIGSRQSTFLRSLQRLYKNFNLDFEEVKHRFEKWCLYGKRKKKAPVGNLGRIQSPTGDSFTYDNNLQAISYDVNLFL